jgi:rhamnosyltransferase subunit B
MVLVIRGTGGDFLPFLRIGKALQQRGHAVTICTHAPYMTQIEAAGLRGVALDDGSALTEVVKSEAILNNRQALLPYNREHFAPRIAADYELVRAQCGLGQTVLVTHSITCLFTKLVAEKLNLPMVVHFAAPQDIFALPYLLELCATLSSEINAFRTTLGLPPVRDWQSWGTTCNRGYGIWPEWFMPPDPSWPARLLPVGFTPGDAAVQAAVPENVRAFLAAGEPPVLITHGTTSPFGDSFFAASAEACRLLGWRGLLTTKQAELVPASLPPELHWTPYLPFDRVLPQMRAIVHHGGIGTSSQALAAGIPQLVLAAGFDRPDNARRLAALGVAHYLPPQQWHAETIAAALGELEGSGEVRARCAELRQRTLAADPIAAICACVEACLADEGHHNAAAAAFGPGVRQSAGAEALRQRLAGLSPDRRALLQRRLAHGQPTLPTRTRNGADEADGRA